MYYFGINPVTRVVENIESLVAPFYCWKKQFKLEKLLMKNRRSFSLDACYQR